MEPTRIGCRVVVWAVTGLVAFVGSYAGTRADIRAMKEWLRRHDRELEQVRNWFADLRR